MSAPRRRSRVDLDLGHPAQCLGEYLVAASFGRLTFVTRARIAGFDEPREQGGVFDVVSTGESRCEMLDRVKHAFGAVRSSVPA